MLEGDDRLWLGLERALGVKDEVVLVILNSFFHGDGLVIELVLEELYFMVPQAVQLAREEGGDVVEGGIQTDLNLVVLRSKFEGGSGFIIHFPERA